MQPTPNARRRAAAAVPAAPAAAGAGLPALPVLRFVMANGLLEIADAPLVQQLLQNEQRARLAAEAEQAALSVCYKLSGEPDNLLPHGGLLTRRLGISLRTAQQLLADGRLKYTCLGRKAYRVSEAAVRELLGDKPPS